MFFLKNFPKFGKKKLGKTKVQLWQDFDECQFFSFFFSQVMTKSDNDYVTDCSLYLRSVTVEDAGKYKVTARNDLGESNATISLNFDSELHFI